MFLAKRRLLLVSILACYASARVLEVIAGPRPRLILVALDVFSALAFALVDGTRHYGARGIFAFAAICLVVGNASENLSIATGFPFGHYRFLDVMGPKLFSVPILLGLAYIGMAYVSWTLARILLGNPSARTGLLGILRLPLVASLIMVAWDLAQDPVWSTFLHAWVWQNAGPWFGVPFSNFAGWYLTVFLIYLLFSLYLRRTSVEKHAPSATMRPAVAFYALCAAGNALQIWVAQPVSIVEDAAGKQWPVAAILRASAFVSIFVMGIFVLLSAARLRNRSRLEAKSCS
jgi:putative membrane protein